MFEFLRTWAGQRGQTSPFPSEDTPFPERFRGRPNVGCVEIAESVDEFCAQVPTGAVARGPRGLPVIDLGACLFSPEEATESDGCRTTYSRDFRMATRTREGLVTATGEVELARALDKKMRGILGRSLRLRSIVAGSCNGCESELAALSNVVFDMARFGVQFVASPRHADGIVITGVVNSNMVEALKRSCAAVPDPKIVIAVGACPASGGPFRGSSAIVGIPPSIRVDLWVPGCPPHPLTILHGLLSLVGRIHSERRSDAPSEVAETRLSPR